MMRVSLALLSSLALSALVLGQSPTAKTLDIYFIDVEGGNAQLWLSPSGESMLIDTGNAGAAAVRDADRIMAAARAAGVTQIDHLITTHYHADHVGGLPELAARIPIREFIDHGPNVQPGAQIDAVLQRYAELHAKAKHTVVRSGDRIPMRNLDWRIVSAAGQVLRTAVPGAGASN